MWSISAYPIKIIKFHNFPLQFCVKTWHFFSSATNCSRNGSPKGGLALVFQTWLHRWTQIVSSWHFETRVTRRKRSKNHIIYIYNYNNYLVMSCPSLLFSTVWVGFDISIDLGDSMGLQPFDSQDTNSRWTLDTNMTWWNPPLKNLGISWNIMVELNLLQYIHGIHMNWLYTWGYNMV